MTRFSSQLQEIGVRTACGTLTRMVQSTTYGGHGVETMASLIQVIYYSAAARSFGSSELQEPRQAIARGILRTCLDLGIDVIAEGVEKASEYRWLAGEGIRLLPGHLLARPSFERLSTAIDFTSGR